MNANLATIRKIKDLVPINGADRIELCTFEDIYWQSVVKKDQFKIGELIIFIEIDTILPKDAPWAQFLKNNTPINEPLRVKTCKLRGCLSQGIVLPLNVLPNNDLVEIGYDVTNLLDVKHYEKPVPVSLAGKIKGNFPSFLRKTDEPRIQNFPNVINEIIGRNVYITRKEDGSSLTAYFNNGNFGVCSRNLDLLELSDNAYWKIVNKFNLHEKFIKLNRNIAIQGELVGAGINGNRLGLTDITLSVFNVWDIDTQSYLNYNDFISICNELELNTVPVLYVGEFKKEWDFKFLLNYADNQCRRNCCENHGRSS